MSAVSHWSMLTFRAMGSSCRIVAPDHDLARHGQDLVLELERLWTRFDPDSEVCRANREAGNLTIVSPVTYELIALAQHARVATGGQFNPLMLDQLVALGYDRRWEELAELPDVLPPPTPAEFAAIELYPEISAIRLPEGTRFDPGGIGKGLAGDMVAAALVEAGAESVQIELGGDVRLVGPAWGGGQWSVLVDGSDHGLASPATISLVEGGVATSSVMRRRWECGGTEVHHLIDTRTGLPAATDLEAVTTVAPTLWWAEVIAKIAVIRGRRGARELLDELQMTGVLVSRDAVDRYEIVHVATAAA